MTAEATKYVLTEEDIAHRKACAYLKGLVIGHAVSMDRKWDGDNMKTPEFNKGYIVGLSSHESKVTMAHILYNRLRHDRPHLKSRQAELEFMYQNQYTLNNMFQGMESDGAKYPAQLRTDIIEEVNSYQTALLEAQREAARLKREQEAREAEERRIVREKKAKEERYRTFLKLKAEFEPEEVSL